MKCRRLRLLFVPLLLITSYSFVWAQAEAPSGVTIRALRNSDVLRMHRSRMKPGEIIAKIVSSPCNFDTFPPVLRELKMKGLPASVLMAMKMAPYGPPLSTRNALPAPEPPPQTTRVQIPAGTTIEIETANPVSSGQAKQGDRMTFLVSRRVLVDDVLVIDRGALARAHVIKRKRAGAWGRGGSLDWVLEDVVAVDGTRVPIKLTDRLEGKNVSTAVVIAAIATGAVIFPYTPPAGLIWAMKKGDEAVLDESRKSTAIVGTNTEVAGLLPKEKKTIFHSVETLNAADKEKGTLGGSGNSFKPTPIGKH